jgi:putative photosynthetic complex assembly protein
MKAHRAGTPPIAANGPAVFPRGALIGAALLVSFTLLAAGFARLFPSDPTAASVHALQPQRALYFSDRDDGAVVVVDGSTGQSIAVLAYGEHGFARGLLRGLVRERRLRGVGADAPFELGYWSDGRLSLSDPALGSRVALAAFGPDNERVFAALLRSNTMRVSHPSHASKR